jgi:hypothetical protein
MSGELSYEQLRAFTLEALAQVKTGQLGSLNSAVATVIANNGFREHATGAGRPVNIFPPSYGASSTPALTGRDMERVQDIFWDLMIEGIVRPGMNVSNSNLPYYHVTEKGLQQVTSAEKTPYDPDGFLKRLRERIPDLDPVIVTYLTESLHTFRIGCLLSSAITLGCASEKALLVLIQAYTDAIPSPRKETFQKKTDGQAIRRQYEEFNKMLQGHLWALLPGEIKENLDSALTTIFNLFRTHRNEAGHPTGKVLAREEAYAHIIAFPFYVRKIYELIGWLKKSSPLV